MKGYKQQKSKVDTLIEELDKIFGKPRKIGNKTGSFIHISSKLKTMQTGNMKKQLNQEEDYSYRHTASFREKNKRIVEQMKERQMRARAYEMEYMKKLTQEVNDNISQENEHEQEKGNISPIDLFDTEGELP